VITRARSVLAAAVGLLAPCLIAVPTGGQTVVPGGSRFSASATGTALYIGALPGGPVAVRAGFSGASVDSIGLTGTTYDELGATVATGGAGRRAEARGRGLDVNGLVVVGAAEAAAPPTTALVADDASLVDIPDVASASLARGEAAPAWSHRTCVAGRPLGFGSGRALDVVLPVATVDVARSDATTELRPAGDTFSVVAESRQAPATVRLLPGTAEETTVEVLGETVLRARADGNPGGAAVEYRAVGMDDAAPLLRITRGKEVVQFTTQEVLGSKGVAFGLTPVVDLWIGERARSDFVALPFVAPDGTGASGAADLVRLRLPIGGPGEVIDVRIGHLEASVAVPAGGVRCPVPVSKVVDKDPVDPGEQFTFTITIPDRSDALAGLACDLASLSAVDVVSADPGVTFSLLSASGGGVIEGNIVNWPELGDYHPGDPPIVLTLTGMMAADSEPGALSDTVRVNAGLTRCQGLPGGRPAPSGAAQLSGRASLRGPVFPGITG
jgi:hypothetical protein